MLLTLHRHLEQYIKIYIESLNNRANSAHLFFNKANDQQTKTTDEPNTSMIGIKYESVWNHSTDKEILKPTVINTAHIIASAM